MKRKVAFLLGPGFEDSEFQKPFDMLEHGGFHLDVLGKRAGEVVKGYKHGTEVTIDKAVSDVEPEDYVALVIPGGHSPDNLRADAKVVDFVRRFEATGRPLAAVCHGPQLLMAAGVVRGRTLTAWPTVQKDLELIPGVTVKDEPVVVDDNLITSRKPEDLEEFSEKILEEIRELEERGGVPEGPGPPLLTQS